MKRVLTVFFFFICNVFVGYIIDSAFAQKNVKVKELDETIQQMNLSLREMSDDELEKAIDQNKKLLEKYSSINFAPNVLFQLSELYIRKANKEFKKEMDEYNNQYKQYQDKEIGLEPVFPRINFGEAINYLYEILENYGSVSFIDKVLYRIALCHQEEENEEKSIQFFKRLITTTPQSNFIPESYFRLGELYFDRSEFEEGIKFYENLITPEMWNNPYFSRALFKLGWSYYNLNQYPEAIVRFITLLNDIEATQRIDGNTSELKKESMFYTALSFSEYGGPEQAIEFFTNIAKLTNEDDRNKIIAQLGTAYIKQNRLVEALNTFEFLLKEFPFDPNAPSYATEIIIVFERNFDLAGANEARGKLVQNFNRESTWYKSQTDSLIKIEALELVKDALHKKGAYHQLKANEVNGNPSEYETAIEQYRYFLESFPNDSSSCIINYSLAECYYALKQYESAAEEYKKVYSIYSKPCYKEEAAYNSVLSFYQASKMYKTTNPQKFTLNGFYGLEGNVTIEVGNPATQNFILACNDMLRMMPHSPNIVDVLMKEAEVLNEINRFDLARRVYLKVVRDYPHSPQYARAATLIAQSYYQEEDFAQAEQWYGTVAATISDTSDLVQKAQVMMASSHYEMAKKYKETGNLNQAAREFAVAAIQYPNSEIAELALVEAGNTLDDIGETDKAALVFEEFIKRYPDSRLIENCVLRAAKYRENLKQWDKAAENYLALRFVDTSNNASAIFAAANCYFEGLKWQKAIETFEEYSQISENPNQKLETLCKIGECYFNLEDFPKARDAFYEAIKYYNITRSSETLNSYYAAKAQFSIGEISYIIFASIDLTTENFQRKNKAFEDVIVEYKEAIDYKVAEWVTASTYKIGKTLEDWANAVLSSPLPENLTDEEKIEYNLVLANQVKPYQLRALETHQKNVEIASKNNINNKWITLSKSHVSMLSSLLEIKNN